MSEVGWDVGVVRTAHPPLTGDVTADACVVGLGASGLAAVEAFADRGLSVVGVDAGVVAGGAAGRNGGFLLGGPAWFLHDALERWGDCAVDLYRETLAELRRLRELLGDDVVRPVGSVRLAGLPGEPVDDDEAADREREAVDCRAHEAALRSHGIAVEEYDGPLGHGIFLPDDAAMNPAVRAAELARRVAHRASLHEHTRVLQVDAGAVVTARGTVSAPAVVVAVDGRLDVLLPVLADRVRTARLQMLATDPVPASVLPPDRLPCPVYGRWGYDYAQRLPDGRVFVGGGRDHAVDQEWTPDTATTPDIQEYLDALAARVVGAPVRASHRWAASVGYTDDGRPLCTEVLPGVVAVGGYSGTGNLVGPVTARAAVAMVLDRAAPPPWASA